MGASDNLRKRSSHLIRQMEIARERGETDYALEALCAIRLKAAEDGDLEAVGLATAHIIVCYKHLYQNTGEQTYHLKMENELTQALALPGSDQLKAVFLMRAADIERERGHFKYAESLCRQAYGLTEKNGYAEAECLGRWAYSKIMVGELTEAESLFARATKIIAGIKSPRTFHRVALKSGLFARRTKLSLAQKRYASAIKHFICGYSLAWEYRIRYGMPQRVKQYHRAISSMLRAGHKA